MSDPRAPARLSQRMAWFVALWGGSVLVTFGVAQALRWMFGRIFS